MARIRAAILIVPVLLWAMLSYAEGPGKILAQAAPSATTTTIYTVPTPAPGGQNSSVVITTIWIANVDATATAHVFRLAVAQGCAADATAQYLYYDVVLAAASSFVQSVALPLSSTDCVRAKSDGAQKLNFELFGTTTP